MTEHLNIQLQDIERHPLERDREIEITAARVQNSSRPQVLDVACGQPASDVISAALSLPMQKHQGTQNPKPQNSLYQSSHLMGKTCFLIFSMLLLLVFLAFFCT